MSLRRSSAVVAFAFGLVALSACKPPSNEPKGYDDVTEANFIEGCTGIVTSGTAESPSTSVVTTDGASSTVCKCEYDWFVANVPFDQKTADSRGDGPDKLDFLELNQQLQDDPTSMPQDIQDSLNNACSKGELVTPNSGQTGTSVAGSDRHRDHDVDHGPVTEPAIETPGRFKRRWYIWAGLTVVFVVVMIVVIAAVRPRPQRDYDEAVRDRFITGCTAQGGAPVQDTCECLYGEIEQSVPFDRFEIIDAMLAAQLQAATGPGQPLKLPDDISAMLQDCIAHELN